MIFTTYWFCLFALVFFPLYWSLRVPGLRLALLLVFCSIFHAHFAGAAGMLPILVLSATTYGAGLWRHKWAIRIGIALPVLALVFYKYTHFLAHGALGFINPAWGNHMETAISSHLPATPPLAVSFFVFEFVHYLYDVSKGQPSIRNPAHFWVFTFFFPSLVAGPIKRYQPFLESLHQGVRHASLDDAKVGLTRIALGLFKKVVVADNLTAAIQFWQPQFEGLTLSGRWLLFGAIGFRILMDFSGYSDIAIGLARLMGIKLLENFNWPYFATSLQDFWQRWHISLSSWIRDYVYIPLGGNRHGLLRKVFNGLVAFALCGLWHGPAWNFVLWGVFHGFGLAINSSYRVIFGAAGRWLGECFTKLPLLGWLTTTIFVFIGWLYFFYPIDEASHMIKLLFLTRK